MYMKTEIMFPNYVIPLLRDACGAAWRRLVDRVSELEETHPESLAFSLMMIRLDSCLECETDSFRAMRGCPACALQTVRRYRNNERDLINLYKTALKDVKAHLKEHPSAILEPEQEAAAPSTALRTERARPARAPRRSSATAAAR